MSHKRNTSRRIRPQSIARRLADEWDAITLRNLLAAARRDLRAAQQEVESLILALPIRRAIEREWAKHPADMRTVGVINPARRRK